MGRPEFILKQLQLKGQLLNGVAVACLVIPFRLLLLVALTHLLQQTPLYFAQLLG